MGEHKNKRPTTEDSVCLISGVACILQKCRIWFLSFETKVFSKYQNHRKKVREAVVKKELVI